jgi:hypothetical protein
MTEKTMNASRFALSLAAGLMLSGALLTQQASSAPAPRPPQSTMPAASHDQASGLPSFADLDKNHKGRLKRSDIPKDVDGLKQLRAHFQEADKNGDGWITPDEYSAYVSATTAPPGH